MRSVHLDEEEDLMFVVNGGKVSRLILVIYW